MGMWCAQQNFNPTHGIVLQLDFTIISSNTGGKTTRINLTQGTATSLVVHRGHITGEEYMQMEISAVPLHS
jgi:hypothetical protein